MSFDTWAGLKGAGYSVVAGCALGAEEGGVCCWGGIGSNEFSICSAFFYLGAEFNYNYSLLMFCGARNY